MAKTYPYTIYRTDGEIDNLILPKPATLTELQEWVGGYIELTYLPDGRSAVVNEEGLLLKLSQNPHFPHYVGSVVAGYID